MTKNIETAPAQPAPGRGVARGELHRRIEAVEAARATLAQKEAAARRLAVIGETARALSAQLSGLRANAASALADHALNGTGRPPKLTEGRADLLERLAEAEAQAEAAGPAIDLVQAEISRAHAELNRSSAAVQDVIVPVLEEELQLLDREIRVLSEKLIPLHTRLAGLRGWATIRSAVMQDDTRRAPYQRLLTAAVEVARVNLVSPQTPTRGTESSIWGDLAERLLTDADAQAVTDAPRAA